MICSLRRREFRKINLIWNTRPNDFAWEYRYALLKVMSFSSRQYLYRLEENDMTVFVLISDCKNLNMHYF